MAQNQETDGIQNISPFDVSTFSGKFIDVRELSEIDAFPFPEKADQTPLSEIRSKVNEYKPDQPIMMVCEKGPRSYEAARIFREHGFTNVSYLGGGNLLYTKIIRHLEQVGTV